VDPVVPLDPFAAFLHISGVSVQPAAPAAPGETITTFISGLGGTSPMVPTGTQPSTFTPTASRVSVSVGGMDAQVIVAGRYASKPPFVALIYQVSFVVPSNSPAGPNAL